VSTFQPSYLAGEHVPELLNGEYIRSCVETTFDDIKLSLNEYIQAAEIYAEVTAAHE